LGRHKVRVSVWEPVVLTGFPPSLLVNAGQYLPMSLRRSLNTYQFTGYKPTLFQLPDPFS